MRRVLESQANPSFEESDQQQKSKAKPDLNGCTFAPEDA